MLHLVFCREARHIPRLGLGGAKRRGGLTDSRLFISESGTPFVLRLSSQSTSPLGQNYFHLRGVIVNIFLLAIKHNDSNLGTSHRKFAPLGERAATGGAGGKKQDEWGCRSRKNNLETVNRPHKFKPVGEFYFSAQIYFFS